VVHILISDDHALLRDGLKPFVAQVSTDITIHEAYDFASTQNIMANNLLDLVILDLRMPGMNGMDGATRLRHEFPKIPMVIISGNMSQDDAILAIDLGILGYLPKSLSGTSMMHALRLMLCGTPYYPPELFISSRDLIPEKTSAASKSSPSLDILTRREKEILTHLVGGASNRKIAEGLGLTEITIKSHLRNVFRKIGATNRTQAVTFALNEGIEPAADTTDA